MNDGSLTVVAKNQSVLDKVMEKVFLLCLHIVGLKVLLFLAGNYITLHLKTNCCFIVTQIH